MSDLTLVDLVNTKKILDSAFAAHFWNDKERILMQDLSDKISRFLKKNEEEGIYP